jgi:hypothetical protein
MKTQPIFRWNRVRLVHTDDAVGTQLPSASSAPPRRCSQLCIQDRTGPAVRPVKNRIRDYNGSVHFKDRLYNRPVKTGRTGQLFVKPVNRLDFIRTAQVKKKNGGVRAAFWLVACVHAPAAPWTMQVPPSLVIRDCMRLAGFVDYCGVHVS